MLGAILALIPTCCWFCPHFLSLNIPSSMPTMPIEQTGYFGSVYIDLCSFSVIHGTWTSAFSMEETRSINGRFLIAMFDYQRLNPRSCFWRRGWADWWRLPARPLRVLRHHHFGLLHEGMVNLAPGLQIYGQNGGCTKKNRPKDGKNGGFVTQNGESAI